MNRRDHRRRKRAVSIVEVLVAALLLAISMAAATYCYTVSRRITARSRDTAEYYAVARQEAERDKFILFKSLFITPGTRLANVTYRSDYYVNARLMGAGLAANATPTVATVDGQQVTAEYRAVSTYALVATGNETIGTRKLGVQKIQVYRRSGNAFETTPVYETAVLYTAPGV